MLQPPPPSPYDIHFGLFGIPVRVAPWFWVMTIVLGWPRAGEPLSSLVSWVMVVFVSILVHEFGHALTARAYGYSPQVLLYQFGGLAMYLPHGRHSRWQELLIILLGPGAGLLLGLLTWLAWLGLTLLKVELTPEAEHFLTQMLFVNIVWSLFNMLPVYPLDGGRCCLEVLMMLRPARGLVWTLWISAICGGLVVVAAVFTQQIFMALMFGMLAAGNVQRLQQLR